METTDSKNLPGTATRALLLVAVLSAMTSAQDVPDRVLVGYWHNWAFSPNNLQLSSMPDEYDVINVSFAIPATLPSFQGFVLQAAVFDPVGNIDVTNGLAFHTGSL